MSAKTGLATRVQQAENLRRRGMGLVQSVADLVAAGHRHPRDLRDVLDRLQELKDHGLFGRVRIINARTREVTIRVNHDDRVVGYAGQDWTTNDRRKDVVPVRSGVEQFEVVFWRFGADGRYSQDEILARLAAEEIEPLTPEGHVEVYRVFREDPALPVPFASLGASWEDRDGRRAVPVVRESRRIRFQTFTSPHHFHDGWWFAGRRKRTV